MPVEVTWLKQSVKGRTVVQGACQKNCADKKVVVIDTFRLTPSKNYEQYAMFGKLCCVFLHAFCKSVEELCFPTRIAGTWPSFRSESGELVKSPVLGL
jgi:hypothetical protein